jgi:polar amino acid transport system substrate-binding protein
MAGLFALGVFLVVVAPRLAHAQATQESVIETIKKRGTLRVGLSTFVPWAMRDKDGNIIGFEVDVANQLAQDLGVKLELVPTAWDGIIPALIAGKFDFIVGGMTITAKRNLTVNFSRPYEYAGTGLAGNKALTTGWKLEDFNSPKVTFACRRATTACFAVQKFFPKAAMRQFDDDAQVAQEVLNGNAQAFTSSEPFPTDTTLDNPDKLWQPLGAGKELNKLPAGVVVRKGDVDALNFLDNFVELHVDDGWLEARYNYWFATHDWKSKVAPTQ